MTKRGYVAASVPLDAINKQPALEGSVEHEHPSPLHLAWARGPLAAVRAISIAQRVDDTASFEDAYRLREVVRHIAYAPGAESLEILLEVSADDPPESSEALARSAREHSRVLGFDLCEFQDVQW